MRLWMLSLAVAPLLGGCMTHISLRDNTVRTATTLTDLNYHQILNHVAMFTANPGALPGIAVINAGTVTVADQKSGTGGTTYNPTLIFPQQAGGQPILGLLLNGNCQRSVTENWSMAPVTDADNMRRIRCAFQLLVTDSDVSECDNCRKRIEQFFLGEADTWDCLIPRGWYHVGHKKDVPKKACHVGHYCDTYVWVMPDGIDGLSHFTITILELATGKPHAPLKTVVKTYKADGALDNTQVTTTEVDKEAIERMRKEYLLDRPRMQLDGVSQQNRGLFFVPH